MLQGKFDYVKLVLHGQTREGYLVDVSNGVGTLAEMNANTAFQMSDASIEIIDRGEKSFLNQQGQAHLFMAHCNYLPECGPLSIIAYWLKHPLYTRGLSARLLHQWSVQAQLPSRAQALQK